MLLIKVMQPDRLYLTIAHACLGDTSHGIWAETALHFLLELSESRELHLLQPRFLRMISDLLPMRMSIKLKGSQSGHLKAVCTLYGGKIRRRDWHHKFAASLKTLFWPSYFGSGRFFCRPVSAECSWVLSINFSSHIRSMQCIRTVS